jgi:hypothetical protein
VHSPCQMLGESRFVLDEGLVDEQFCRSVGQLGRLPSLNLLLQGAKVSLHPVDSNSAHHLSGEVARGVPLSMSRTRSEYLDAAASGRSVAADVLVREEPDDEEDEQDDGTEEYDDDDKGDDEGYSE